MDRHTGTKFEPGCPKRATVTSCRCREAASVLAESRGQFLDRLMWEDSSSHAWTEKEELADLVGDKVRSDLYLSALGND